MFHAPQQLLHVSGCFRTGAQKHGTQKHIFYRQPARYTDGTPGMVVVAMAQAKHIDLFYAQVTKIRQQHHAGNICIPLQAARID